MSVKLFQNGTLFAIILCISLASNRISQELLRNRECECYQKFQGYSCYCQGNLDIYLEDKVANLTLNCDKGNDFNSYSFMSQMTLENIHFLYLGLNGCLPPDSGYNSVLPQRIFDERINESVRVNEMRIHCRDLKTFELKKHHLQYLHDLQIFYIICPALSVLPRDLLQNVTLLETRDIFINNTALEYVPVEILSSVPSLTSLYIHNSKLKSVPSLEILKELKYFGISGNNLEELDDDIFLFNKNLSRIILSRNRLTMLPSSICNLANLAILDAAQNRIKFINLTCLFLTDVLRYLVLNDNLLEVLGPQFSPQSMPLSTNSTLMAPLIIETGIGQKISLIPNLGSNSTTTYIKKKYVSISSGKVLISYSRKTAFSLKFKCQGNNLTWIPENTFFDRKNLEEVDLAFNKILNIPAKLFSQNMRLRSIQLSNNLISNIPEMLLAKNQLLAYFDISGNNIQTLNENLFYGLWNLKEINLSHNKIEHLPERMFLHQNFPMDSLLKLNLAQNNLSSLPTLNLSKLVDLNVANNRLENITIDTLKYLYVLKHINLSHNYIGNFDLYMAPTSDFSHKSLKRLECIDLSHNQLSTYPDLTQVDGTIKTLNLSGNILHEHALDIYGYFWRYLPSPTQPLNLQILDLSKNSLGKIFLPRDSAPPIHYLEYKNANLKYLDLSWNEISLSGCREPQIIGKWNKCDSFLDGADTLEVIILAHNQIEVIPQYFSLLPRLRIADFSYNQIKTVSYYNFFYMRGISQMKDCDSKENNTWNWDNNKFPRSHCLEIDLRHNQISTVDLPETKMQKVPANCHVNDNFARVVMLMGHNPIVCGCQIFRLHQYYLKEIRPVSDEEAWQKKYIMLPALINIQDLLCSEPHTMKGRSVSDPETWMHHLMPLIGHCFLAGEFTNLSLHVLKTMIMDIEPFDTSYGWYLETVYNFSSVQDN